MAKFVFPVLLHHTETLVKPLDDSLCNHTQLTRQRETLFNKKIHYDDVLLSGREQD